MHIASVSVGEPGSEESHGENSVGASLPKMEEELKSVSSYLLAFFCFLVHQCFSSLSKLVYSSLRFIQVNGGN